MTIDGFNGADTRTGSTYLVQDDMSELMHVAFFDEFPEKDSSSAVQQSGILTHTCISANLPGMGIILSMTNNPCNPLQKQVVINTAPALQKTHSGTPDSIKAAVMKINTCN